MDHFVFPPFRLDVDNHCLWRETTVVPLRPKTFAVLQYLVTRRGRFVSNDELLQAVWPDVMVGEAMPRLCIRELRQALGDAVKHPRFIETQPRRGYRFIAPRTTQAVRSPGSPPTPMLVGREAELQHLHGWFVQARNGARQIVFITGEPGIGKTTVVEAFLAQVATGCNDLKVAQGQCVEHYGVGEAYLPIFEALQRLGSALGNDALRALLRADTGAVTLIQRFGSAANLNIHLHCLVLDGLYLNRAGAAVFHEAAAPSTDELEAVLLKIIKRTMQLLTRLGVLIEEPEGSYLAETDSDGALRSLQAASCTYRIALGPRAGQKVLSLQSLPSQARPSTPELGVNAHGFSLHAAVRWRADQRKELEQLCRYITRPAIANERLKRNRAGQVVLQLKSPYKDGTTHIAMEPLEFMERLAALVPRPRLHLIRFHGVLAPNAKLRSKIVPTPAERATEPPTDHAQGQGETPRMSWARRLKRVFDSDIEHCPNCGGALKIIACPEPSSKGRHRRSAGDHQDPQPSRPTDPRPAPCPSSPSRSIPDNLRTRKPLANASRQGTFRAPPDRSPAKPPGTTVGFLSSRKGIDISRGPAI